MGVGGGGGRVKPLVKRIFHSFLNSLNCAHYIVNYLAKRRIQYFSFLANYTHYANDNHFLHVLHAKTK